MSKFFHGVPHDDSLDDKYDHNAKFSPETTMLKKKGLFKWELFADDKVILAYIHHTILVFEGENWGPWKCSYLFSYIRNIFKNLFFLVVKMTD